MNFKSLIDFKKILPHIAIVASFVALSVLYFLPVVQGMQLPQMDNIHAKGAAQELIQYEAETGEKAQWTDSMFGGMPAYQIKGDASHNIFRTFNRWTRLGLPFTTIAILFLYMLGFYLLMVSLKMNRWLAFAGAVAFAFGSYNLIIIIAGHITKAYAIALMPAVLAGVMLVFNGKRIIGGAYTMLALGMEIAYNHVQITYYLALAIMVLLISKFVYALKDKALPEFAKSVGVLAIAAVLAVLPCVTNLWTTYEYGKYSIRGASELSVAEGDKKTSGLDKDYALSWSYGIHETPTLLIPNIVGGASEAIGYDLKSVNSLDPQLRDAVAQSVSKYWGGRSFTSGPVYLGAVVCFLFFLGCFFYNGREKWWLIAATVLSIFLAWGKNFMPFTDLMFYYFPLYNKFRTVEMALVIASVTVPTLGFLGLKELYESPELIRYRMGKFFGAIGLTAGFALLIALFPTLFYSYLTPDEAVQFASLKAQDTTGMYALFEQGVIDARIELTRADAMRSAIFVLLASSALWFYATRKLNVRYTMMTLIALILIDLWQIDKRYLGEDDFQKKSKARNEFVMSAADKAILADKEPHRVISLYRNPFNEVNTSYFHQSVGGYHGAKLRRYQDVIDRYLSAEWQTMVGALRSQDYEAINSVLSSATALNMLNTKYLIYNPDADPLVNRNAFGAAWFVDDVAVAASADEAIQMIGEADLRKTAIVEREGVSSVADSAGSIVRIAYAPDKLTCRSSSPVGRLAVFSEIYYPAGWKAFIDGEETEILQANYILRALEIPAGEHTIDFRFEPTSFSVGKIISTIGSIIVVLLLLVAIVLERRRSVNQAEEK